MTTAAVLSSCIRQPFLVVTAARSGLGEGAADHHPLDLVGALEDLHHLGLAHVALDREVAGVAVAAEHLHGVGGHLHRVVGGDQLGDRGLGAERQALVLEPGRGAGRWPGPTRPRRPCRRARTPSPWWSMIRFPKVSRSLA